MFPAFSCMHKSVQRSLRYVLVFLYSESVELADYKEQPGMCRFLFKSLFSLTWRSRHRRKPSPHPLITKNGLQVLLQVLLQSKYTVVTANFWYDECFSTLMVTYSRYGVHFVLLGNFGSLDSHQPPKLCCKPVKYVVPPNFPNTNQTVLQDAQEQAGSKEEPFYNPQDMNVLHPGARHPVSMS